MAPGVFCAPTRSLQARLLALLLAFAACVASCRAQSQTLIERLEEERSQIRDAELHSSPEHQGYLWAHIAADYRTAADFSRSEEAYNRSIQLFKGVPTSKFNYATVLDNLGTLYLLYWHMDEAESCMKKALALRRQIGDEINIAISLQHLADLDVARHRFKDAEREAALAAPALLSNVSTNATSAVAVLSTLSYAHCKLNNCAQGLLDAQHSLAIARTELKPEALQTGLTLMALGYAQSRTGQPQDAEKTLLQGIAIVKKQSAPGDPMLLYSMLEYREYLKTMHRIPDVKQIDAQLSNLQHPCVNCSVSVHSLSNAMR